MSNRTHESSASNSTASDNSPDEKQSQKGFKTGSSYQHAHAPEEEENYDMEVEYNEVL